MDLRLCFRLLLSLAVMVGAAGPCFGARWYEDYATAVANIEAGECSPEAIELLGAAVVDRPRAKRKSLTYGQRRIEYLPYYQLARAHLLCDNAALARQYLAAAEREGVAGEVERSAVASQLAALEEQQAQAKQPTFDVEAFAQRTARAEQRIERCEAALGRISDLASDALLAEILTADAALAGRRDEALNRLQQARDGIAAAREGRDPLALADATGMAVELAGELADFERELARRLDIRRQAEQAEQLTPTPPPVAEPEPTLAVVPTTGTPTPTPTPRIVRPVPTQPSTLLVPDDLRRAAVRYFDRDYREVATILAEISFASDRERAAAHLLRAAAGFARHRAGPEGEEDLLAAATADVRQCQHLDPVMQPDGRAFSPAFIEFFESSRQKPTGSPGNE